MFYWILKHILVGPLVHVLFRPRLVGVSNIPKSGPLILASNHLSFIDSVILPLMIKRRIHFLAASNYFTGRSIGSRLLGRFLLATGMIPLDRSGGKASEASLRAGLSVLSRGAALGIYPEGSRSLDGKMHRGRTGIARLIVESGAQVVPVAMIDTEKVIPVGSKSVVPRIQRIGITFGKPIDFSEYIENGADHAALRVMTDRIMADIRVMSGQEYVDEYGASASRR
jgi:1-acyl-sn-glycerol-3-phosphate acyltransferase